MRQQEGRLRIRGGRVIDPAAGVDAVLDVRVEDGKVAAVGGAEALGAPLPGEETIDARGLWVVPGLVDMHVHLREPGEEYKEDVRSGLLAACAGGFTAVACMPNTSPPNDCRAVTEMLLAKAAEAGGARLHPVAAITRGREGKFPTEMGDLLAAGAVAFSDDGRCVASASVMRRAMEYAASFDALLVQHAEDETLVKGGLGHEGAAGVRAGLGGMPVEAEEVVVARDLVLARLTGCRYHVAHVSSPEAVRMIERARADGVRVTAEVTPHHLLLSDEAAASYDTNAKVNPPLRSEGQRRALLDLLRRGAIDAIASDHAPHSVLEKEGDFASAAFGISGLDTALPLVLGLVADGSLAPARMVEAMAVAPRRILGLPGGTLAQGAPADITLIDPARSFVIDTARFLSKGKNSPFGGRAAPGGCRATIVGGKVLHDAHAPGRP